MAKKKSSQINYAAKRRLSRRIDAGKAPEPAGGQPPISGLVMRDCSVSNATVGLRVEGGAVHAERFKTRNVDQPVVNDGGDVRLTDPDVRAPGE